MIAKFKKKKALDFLKRFQGLNVGNHFVFDPHSKGKPSDKVFWFRDRSELNQALLLEKPFEAPSISAGPHRPSFGMEFDGSLYPCKMFNEFSFDNTFSQRIRNATVKKITISGPTVELTNVQSMFVQVRARGGEITIKDCEIANLQIQFPENDIECVIRLENSEIIALRLGSLPKVREVEIRSCRFARFEFSKEELSSIGFVLNNDFRNRDRASFSFLHNWAVANGNAAIAHLARGEELAIELKTAVGLEKALLWFWGLFADFGKRPFLPMLWIFLSGLSLFATMAACGTSINLSPDQLSGWKKSLAVVEGVNDDLYRAAVGTIEATLSPLMVFSRFSLIVPDTFGAAVLKAVHGYFSISMIVLIGFSLRRRFKIPT